MGQPSGGNSVENRTAPVRGGVLQRPLGRTGSPSYGGRVRGDTSRRRRISRPPCVRVRRLSDPPDSTPTPTTSGRDRRTPVPVSRSGTGGVGTVSTRRLQPEGRRTFPSPSSVPTGPRPWTKITLGPGLTSESSPNPPCRFGTSRTERGRPLARESG